LCFPPQKGAEPPHQFSAHVHSGQTAGWIKTETALGTDVGLGPGHIVLDGDPASLPQKGAEPPHQFSAQPHSGQTVGCTKMPLGMEVGLRPGDFVRWGSSPSPKRGRSPQLSAHVYCGQTARRIKMPLGTEVGLGPNDIVLHGAPTPPHQKGTARNFRSMSIVAERLYVSGYHLVRR